LRNIARREPEYFRGGFSEDETHLVTF